MRGRGRTGPERGLHKVGGKRSSPKVSCESFLARNQVRGRSLARSLATAPAGTFLPPSMDRDSHSEDTLSTMVLENIKNKLIHAFRTTGESRVGAPGSGPPVRPLGVGRSYQANEELRRAQIDGAITWLRSELRRFERPL
ncbi:uncharacterized protein si:ch211-153f2.3 isoform X2 [Betta splendens]|uniref:Uncharacterized protein si:ch211-153f2.3 isoform X2 n=1 Tax=Betta splendens TaxID=158456 RepID=A0A9W2Y4G5_BETSP|nr:uncharacterized protein si:ch211-153f2.3 isoform X2 [Betta splendens]